MEEQKREQFAKIAYELIDKYEQVLSDPDNVRDFKVEDAMQSCVVALYSYFVGKLITVPSDQIVKCLVTLLLELDKDIKPTLDALKTIKPSDASLN